MSTLDPKEEQVFEVGDRTVLKMRNQSFINDEFGTMVSRPPRPAVGPMTIATEPVSEPPDRLARMERKLDEVLELVKALEQRLR